MIRNLARNLLLSLSAVLVFLFLSEGLTRIGLFIYTGSPLSFVFGIDEAVKVWTDQDMMTGFVRTEQEEAETVALAVGEPNPEAVTIAAFGGSTTYGYNCSSTASSWPEEMQKNLNGYYSRDKRGYRVLNYGANGTNSDYAVEKLKIEGAKGRMDFVLWASFVNESDILFTGPKRNLEELSGRKEFGTYLRNKKISFTSFRYRLLAHRIDKTFRKYSLFYWILSRMMDKAKASAASILNLERTKPAGYWKELKDHDSLISLALENYRINFLEAKRYCDLHGIRMVLVREPENVHTGSPDIFHAGFRRSLDGLMTELSERYAVPLINVQEDYELKDLPPNLFCDICHQTREGHILTSEIIARELRRILASGTRRAALR